MAWTTPRTWLAVEFSVGDRVRSVVGFPGVPAWTEGIVDEKYPGGLTVAWDTPSSRLPLDYAERAVKGVRVGATLRERVRLSGTPQDGFDRDRNSSMLQLVRPFQAIRSAPWPTPTWVADEPVTPAIMNVAVLDNLDRFKQKASEATADQAAKAMKALDAAITRFSEGIVAIPEESPLYRLDEARESLRADAALIASRGIVPAAVIGAAWLDFNNNLHFIDQQGKERIVQAAAVGTPGPPDEQAAPEGQPVRRIKLEDEER